VPEAAQRLRHLSEASDRLRGESAPVQSDESTVYVVQAEIPGERSATPGPHSQSWCVRSSYHSIVRSLRFFARQRARNSSLRSLTLTSRAARERPAGRATIVPPMSVRNGAQDRCGHPERKTCAVPATRKTGAVTGVRKIEKPVR
jgi:hypothetical protein